jgi:ABC-type amino acid transport substrate-binding protein
MNSPYTTFFLQHLHKAAALTHKLLSIAVISAISISIHAEVFKISVVEYAPHINNSNTQPQGKAIDYINRIISSINGTATYTFMPGKRAIAELNSGNVDMVLPIDEPDVSLNKLSPPLFLVVPGLCFKKANFIPILSTPKRLDNLKVAHAAGLNIVPTLVNSKAKLNPLSGTDVIVRGTQMLKAGRIDALYHSNPVALYHHRNPHAKEVACSNFYGYTSKSYIIIGNQTSKLTAFKNAYIKSMKIKPYSIFFNEA